MENNNKSFINSRHYNEICQQIADAGENYMKLLNDVHTISEEDSNDYNRILSEAAQPLIEFSIFIRAQYKMLPNMESSLPPSIRKHIAEIVKLMLKPEKDENAK